MKKATEKTVPELSSMIEQNKKREKTYYGNVECRKFSILASFMKTVPCFQVSTIHIHVNTALANTVYSNVMQ